MLSPVGSYASTSDPRLHFGLGDATAIDELKYIARRRQERFAVAQIDRIVP